MNSKELVILKDDLNNYLNSIKIDEFNYLPALKGVTKTGKSLSLGFNCYVIKCLFILNEWNNLDDKIKNDWVNYINSFQINNENFPQNSYIDENYIKSFNNFFSGHNLKFKLKQAMNLLGSNYETKNVYLTNSIRAETKQAISTLNQINYQNKLQYLDFPKDSDEINLFLSNLNWQKPWSAGAQFASLCVFTETQLDNNENRLSKDALIKFVDNLVNKEDGFYYLGDTPSTQEVVNGTMKIITGLDWINYDIHYPEKIIDLCLDFSISSEGCDIVDIVYVLYKCSLTSEYRMHDIDDYFNNVYIEIMKHYIKEENGFSYFIDKSQVNYYGLKITKGFKTADIHGTTLLLWAISMIENFKKESDLFQTLKP